MTDEEKAEEYRKATYILTSDSLKELVEKCYLDGLAEGRKEKELSYKVGKVTKAELNKCKTIEEKMEWLGKVLGQAIFKNDMNYAVWVNVQKNNIIETLGKEIEEQKVIHESDKKSISLIIEKGKELEKEISVLLSCANCPENKGGYICAKEYNNKCLSQKIEYIKELETQIENYKLSENESKEIIAELKAQVEKYKTEKNYYDNLCHKKTVECDDLRKGIKQFQLDNEQFLKKIEELEAPIEKIKCCGNCKHFIYGYCMADKSCHINEHKEWKLAE